MKKTLGKRLLSGITSALLGVSAFTQAMPLGNASLLKARAADGTASASNDGLPSMTSSYKESIWYRGGPLGIAGDFHIFAFDTAEVGVHTNGNVAAPYVIGGNASPNQYVGRLVNVIGKEWDASGAIMNNITDVIVPADYNVYADSNKIKLSYPTVKDSFYVEKGSEADTMTINHLPNLGKSYIGHWTSSFIDFDTLKADYETMSDDFVAKKQNAKVEQQTKGTDHYILITLNPEGENVVNLKYSDLFPEPDRESPGSENNEKSLSNNPDHCGIKIVGLNIESYKENITVVKSDGSTEQKEVDASKINGNQSLIINLDMTGVAENEAIGKDIALVSLCDKINFYGMNALDKIEGKETFFEKWDAIGDDSVLNIKNGEGTVTNGSNILLNIANAPDITSDTSNVIAEKQMSIAMGILVTYGSYMKKENHIESSVHQIEIFD